MALLTTVVVSFTTVVVRAVESESGAWAYFEESGVGVGRKKFDESKSEEKI